MDRTVATQVAAMLVVLAILVRWIPVDDPQRDPLGRGLPLEALSLDAYLGELEARDPLAPVAFMRGYGKKDPEIWKGYFIRRLREAQLIQEQFAEDPSVFVQFKGVPRNEMWPLMYDLYPVPMVGTWAEDGSTEDEPTLPGATVIETRLERPVDFDQTQQAAEGAELEVPSESADPEELEALDELRRQQRRAERRAARGLDPEDGR